MRYSILVNVGSTCYVSEDEGRSWSSSVREIPPANISRLKGVATLSDLPETDASVRMLWTEVNISENGIGIAAGDDLNLGFFRTRTRIFITQNGGKTWCERRIRVRPFFSFLKLLLSLPGWWPFNCISGDLIIARDTVFIPITYSDFENEYPYTHILFSDNLGLTWNYRKIDGFCSLGCTLVNGWDDTVISPRNGYYMESRNLGYTWEKHWFSTRRPEDYRGSEEIIYRNLLDRIVCADPQTWYALCLHYISKTEHKVEVLKSEDGGDIWEHLTDLKCVDEAMYGRLVSIENMRFN